MSLASPAPAGARPDGRRRYHPTDFGDRPWQALVAFAGRHADAFQCAVPYRVVRQSVDGAPLRPATVEVLRSSLVDRYASLLRWGEVIDVPVEVLTFRHDPAVRRFVAASPRLTDWVWAKRMPEDPTFLVRGEPLVASDSRTGRVAVFASPDEHDELTRRLGVRLVEPLGVVCEPWPTP